MTAEEVEASSQNHYTVEKKAGIVVKDEGKTKTIGDQSLPVCPIIELPLQKVQPQTIIVQISDKGSYSLIKMPPIERIMDEGKAWVRKVMTPYVYILCMYVLLIYTFRV